MSNQLQASHNPTEAQAIASMSAVFQELREIDGVPVLILPEGHAATPLGHLLQQPARKRGTTVLSDEASFVAVVNDQQNHTTRLFSTINPPTFTAVFNHVAHEAGWGDHQAKYNAPLSPEWKTWAAMDGKHSNQTDFAQFLENNLPDLVQPNGATMLEICRTLEAKKKVNFASSVRLSDGSTQFTYEEDVQGSAHKGQLAVPEQFVIGIPVFENGQPWRIDVRFRYRIQDGGKLILWIELIRPHKVIEEAVKELRNSIAKATDLPILNGSPNAI